ncbi:hypothetical protein M8J76_010520 [Diaphorina citri]|nr:hypothetical protein M8J75_008128 [Diaphorina citri]KAI5737149.1 hypothetical protein M8J76_010520 [Diaphorina citri]
MWVLCVFSIALLSINIHGTSGYKHKDSFHEELFIKPLLSGHIYSYFQFTTLWEIDGNFNDEYFTNSHLFPRPLGEFIKSYGIKEMHISLTEGVWRHKSWGYPIVEAGPGAELWVWFKNGTENIDQNWKDLVNSLSGLLCATMNFMEKANSLSPQLSLRPTGAFNVKEKLNNQNVKYATLPREIVCTENLTPWIKLLPCDNKRGLSTLLNSKNIHNTNYHSLGINFRHICMDKACTRVGLELKQTVSLVHDLIIVGAYDFNWSMRKLFGNGVPSSCSQAETSAVYVDITANLTGPVFEIFPDPTQVLTSLHGGQKHHIAMYNLIEITKERIFNVYTIHEKPRVSPVSIQPTLYAHRYITGYGQERGGIVTKIHNKHRTPLKIIYLENIPWFTPLYYHTLKITSGNKEIIPLIKKYIPGKARVRPYYLEVAFEAPARSVTTLSVDFTYMFLKWQEYPPDANHGFYLGSAIITALLPTARNYTAIPQTQSLIKNSFNISRDGYLVQLRTEALIVALPTPDFSMPYNVICLACTVVALAFGPLHNIASKRLRLTVIRHRTILQRLKRVLNVVTGKHAANKSDDEDEDKKENKEEKRKEETKDKAQTETDEGSCKVRDTKKDK